MCQKTRDILSPTNNHSHAINRRNLMKLASLSSIGLLTNQTVTQNKALAQTANSDNSSNMTAIKSICAWDQSSSDGPSIIEDPAGFEDGELARHESFIAEAITLSQQAESHCNHPFGALLVLPPAEGEPDDDYKIILKGENRVYTDNDEVQHAETRLISDANKNDYITKDMMSRAILYTSAEPCAMCCGAIFWSGVRTVVYAAPHDSFGTSSFPVPCREVFKYAAVDEAVTVIGPVLAEASIPVVGGYFANRWQNISGGCRISNKL